MRLHVLPMIPRLAIRLVFLILVGPVLASAAHAQSAAPPINFSTRMRVETGDNVGIGGFIISGTGLKHVVIRALGPSLKGSGLTALLADPTLELYDSTTGVLLDTNDNWKNDPEQQRLKNDKLAPTDNLEAALDRDLPPGSYTAVVRGKNDATGVGLVEVYDVDSSTQSSLANISTRAFVQTGNNIVIAGFVLRAGTVGERIAIRGLGATLEKAGVQGVLPDPQLEIRNANGTTLISNDDWADDAGQARELRDAGLAPDNVLESGIVAAFAPGPYTALFSDVKKKTGIGLIEVYDLGRASDATVTIEQVQTGTTFAIEKQHVTFFPTQTNGSFRIIIRKPSVINPSGISARAALLGQTAALPFTASAKDIVDAIIAIPNSYYAYDQPGNLELIQGSFSYFASQGAVNREPVVTVDSGKTVASGFTIEFGSLVGTTTTFPGYNTWVAGMPPIEIAIP
jgi:hypothetical protein